MKNLLFILICLIAACSSSSKIKEGIWTGYITPMNHPDISNPVAYDVAYKDNSLTITIIGPDGISVLTQNSHIEKDTFF